MGPIALLSAIIIISGINAENIICRVSVSPIPEGGSTAIICVFPFDLVENNASFSILHTEPGTHHTVAECKWNSTRQNHSCKYIYQESKYKVVWINREVTLIITRANRLQAGNYSCELLEQKGHTSSPCTLDVTETPFVTSCTAYSVHREKRSEVICHFNKNLNDLHVGFGVLRQPLSAQGDNSEYFVMYCTWKDETPDCWLENGYSFNKTISSTLTLKLPQDNQGRYTCRAHSSLEGQEEPCEIKTSDAQRELRCRVGDDLCRQLNWKYTGEINKDFVCCPTRSGQGFSIDMGLTAPDNCKCNNGTEEEYANHASGLRAGSFVLHVLWVTLTWCVFRAARLF